MSTPANQNVNIQIEESEATGGAGSCERFKLRQERRRSMLQHIRKVVVAIGIGFVLTLAGPRTDAQDVKYNFMPGTNFSQFHTYKWVTIAGAQYPNQILDQEIKNAFDSQLAAKGLTKVTSGNADLFIGYQTALHQEAQWNAYGMGGGLRWGGGMATATQSTINVGSFVLDMYDPATKQLVWTGTATKTLDPSSNQEKNMERINKAAEKLLKHYPPEQK
jgi:hypothetical protein